MNTENQKNDSAGSTAANKYPYEKLDFKWNRPPFDRTMIKQYAQGSNLQGWLHCLGTLAILTTSGAAAYYFYLHQQWIWMALALYVHGGLVAFNPQAHEFSHGKVFKTSWLNQLFKRIFELIHWPTNGAEYRMSHTYHHRYTTHRKGDGEVVLPMPRTWEQVMCKALDIIDINGFIFTVYDRVYGLFVPFLKNPRRSLWQRYVYENSTVKEQRDSYWTRAGQFLFHIIFAAAAITTGHWFLIVVVTLAPFYGGRWYHFLVHDTMHSGLEPDTDDFRLCCRTVHLDPFTSFLYWHMEWHTEHHTYPGVPSYNLKHIHNIDRDYWKKPISLAAAWKEMNEDGRREMAL